MLHIKDIEAFARINEALARRGDGDAGRSGAQADRTEAPALRRTVPHPSPLPMAARDDSGPEENAGQVSGYGYTFDVQTLPPGPARFFGRLFRRR